MAARLVFIALVLVSVSYFSFVVARRLAGLRAARADLRFDRLGERLTRLFREVVLQERVLRRRPWAGLLHALVMWGFFVFAWISAEHLWVGLIGLVHARAYTGGYEAFAAGWAVAVLAGILGLAFRRFVLRPQALGGEISFGSAAVAVLIIVLMLSYLELWRGDPATTPRWAAMWWVHTVALLGMLWVIPNSKHLHLLLAPVAVFFRDGETTSATRPLDESNDDDFGMVRLADLSRKDVLDVNACVECGRCTDVCPANLTGGSLDPKRIVLDLRRGLLTAPDLAEARAAGTAEEVASGAAFVGEDELFQCFTCGACEQACPVGIEHVGKKIVDLRRGLVSEGRTNSDKLADLFRTMERAPHNGWGASAAVRRKLVEDFPVFDGSQEWLLWLGCGCNYDPHGNDVARAMRKILEAARVSWGVLAAETCCGDPARRAGNEYLYMELSEKVVDALEQSGAKRVVTCDPHCCRTLDVDYRQIPRYAALGLSVVHHTELLAELVTDLKLNPQEETIAYHDPCYLARGRGVTDAPRLLLETAGADLVEMAHHGRDTLCCGAGGGQLYIADDRRETAERGRANDLRFAEAASTGATTVATACPYCPIMLNDAAGRSGRADVRVLDVAEIVASRLET